MRSIKNTKQKKNKGGCKVFSIIEEIYSEHNSWKRERDLENVKEIVAEFEERGNTEIRQQEKLNIAEKRDFRREELPERYMVKMLYEWDDRKFEDKYLKRLERN